MLFIFISDSSVIAYFLLFSSLPSIDANSCPAADDVILHLLPVRLSGIVIVICSVTLAAEVPIERTFINLEVGRV
jgi:hypothetical protein